MIAYDIVSVDPRADREHEQMGSKAKFWYRSDEHKWLYKRCREGTGEDWAEKLGEVVAAQLDLPHARVELASLGDERGSISLDIVGDATLVHGNELLWEIDPNYPKSQSWGVTAHSVENVIAVLSTPQLLPPAGTHDGMSAAQVFAGYLALDALIGNTDRHHENWALLRDGDQLALAPTYDHASSLGRELRDPRRGLKLQQGIGHYAAKARSALYADSTAKRPLGTHAAFFAFCEGVPGARDAWVQRIGALTSDDLDEIISRAPRHRITETAAKFALQLMLENRRLLCSGSS